MRVCITGAAGFIGSNLADLLLQNGFEVLGIDNFDSYYARTIKEQNITNALFHKNFQFAECDILDVTKTEELIKEYHPEIIIHLAALAGVRNSVLYPDMYYKTNVIGTENIAKLAVKYNVKKIIFASSSSVYGNCKEDIFREDLTNLQPISPYAETKLECECLLEEYQKKYGINVVCLRFFTVYGKRQRPDLAISKFTNLIMAGKKLPVYGNGSKIRDYTHISDILSGIMASIDYDKTNFEIINIGSGQKISVLDVINTIEKVTDKKAIIEYLPEQSGDVEKTCASLAKAKRLLGYYPKMDFLNGISDFCSTYSSK